MAEFFPSANSPDDGLWRNMFVFAWIETKTVAGELYFFQFVVAGSFLYTSFFL